MDNRDDLMDLDIEHADPSNANSAQADSRALPGDESKLFFHGLKG